MIQEDTLASLRLKLQEITEIESSVCSDEYFALFCGLFRRISGSRPGRTVVKPFKNRAYDGETDSAFFWCEMFPALLHPIQKPLFPALLGCVFFDQNLQQVQPGFTMGYGQALVSPPATLDFSCLRLPQKIASQLLLNCGR